MVRSTTRPRRARVRLGIGLAVALGASSAAAGDLPTAVLSPGGERHPQIEKQLRTAIKGELRWVGAVGAQAIDWDRVSEAVLVDTVLREAHELRAKVIVVYAVQSQRRRRRADLRLDLAVFDSRGTLVGTGSLDLPIRGRGETRGPVVSQLGVSMALKAWLADAELPEPPAPARATRAAPKPVAAPPRVAESAPAAATEESAERPDGTHVDRVLHARAFTQIRGRYFDYFDYDGLSQNLREYRSGVSPAFGGSIEVYPLRYTSEGGSVLRVGLEGTFAADLGQSARLGEGTVEGRQVAIIHRWMDWRAGPSVRLDLAAVLLELSASAGMVEARFEAPADFAWAGMLPSVEYVHLRFGVGARYELEWLALEGELAYRMVVGRGAVGDQLFPRAAVGGMDMRVGISRQLWWGLEAYATVDLEPFYYDFRSRSGDAHRAGVALDLHAAGELGLGWVL